MLSDSSEHTLLFLPVRLRSRPLMNADYCLDVLFGEGNARLGQLPAVGRPRLGLPLCVTASTTTAPIDHGPIELPSRLDKCYSNDVFVHSIRVLGPREAVREHLVRLDGDILSVHLAGDTARLV